MKKFIIIIGGVAAVAATYVGSRLWAQQTQPAAAVSAPTQTRVAFVNMDVIFQKYTKFKVYEDEMKKTVESYRPQAEKMKADILAWKKATEAPDFDKSKLESYMVAIRNKTREYEDLAETVKKYLGKKSEEHIVQLFKEINEMVQQYAAQNGFHVVFAYGENLQDPFNYSNIMRKMQGMQVSCAPMYIAPGLDISQGVAAALNLRNPVAAGTVPGAIQPASGTQQK